MPPRIGSWRRAFWDIVRWRRRPAGIGVSRSLLTIWQRQYRDGAFETDALPAFIPVTLSLGSPPAVPTTATVAEHDTAGVQLEIVLRNRRRLPVPSAVDPEVLARVLPVLDDR